jgi:dTDP-4-amino-4,6-dideoxygalactose transaminase
MEPAIPFIDLEAQATRLGNSVNDAIGKVLGHGRFIMGPEIEELERALESFTGASHSVTCSNGTDALVLALLAAGIGPGDGVALPSFTFAATAEAVAAIGAVPLFVDVAGETFNIDPASLSEVLTLDGDPNIRAVIPVDLFGLPADHQEIERLAVDHDVIVIADAAQSFGASVEGARVGTLAPITTTSFFPAKPLGCYGDGGAVFTQNSEIAAIIRSLRLHGQGRDRYENVRIGMNGRLDTIQAAVLLEKLKIFEEEMTSRQRVAARYSAALSSSLIVPLVPEGSTSAWAQYTIRVRDRAPLAEALARAGIPTAIYYPVPLHQQPAYRSFPTAPRGLPTSEALAGEVLSLPFHPYLDPTTQDRIVEVVLSEVR